MGIDLGTSGARALVVDQAGHVVAAGRAPLPAAEPHPLGWREQDSRTWWQGVCVATQQALVELQGAGRPVDSVAAVSVTSTSGTVLLLDAAGQPLRPALLYNDARATAEAQAVNQVGQALWARLGYRMNASFGLPKLLWLRRHEPHTWSAAAYAVHAADFLAGRLTGMPGVSDTSNALKTGYDLLNLCWPEEVLRSLDLDPARLPTVLRPGEAMGTVSARAAEETGLPAGIPVVAGMTDGCAAQLAAGSVAPGQWCTTIGSTLVIKGVTRSLLHDPTGAVYSHRHPEGYWMPGGASNTGGAVLAATFGRERLAILDQQARFPTDLLVYPLPGRGERFPFVHPAAEAFTLGSPAGAAELYAAHLEGIAYVERLAYDRLLALGAEVEGAIASSGGGAGSPTWLQVRADVLGRPVVVPVAPEAAFGAAMLAFSHVRRVQLSAVARTMVRAVATYEPRPALTAAYEERYQRFCGFLRERGYLVNE